MRCRNFASWGRKRRLTFIFGASSNPPTYLPKTPEGGRGEIRSSRKQKERKKGCRPYVGPKTVVLTGRNERETERERGGEGEKR